MPGVFYWVVAPWGDLMLPAVHSPGVATASFRHLKTKIRISDHVDPRTRGLPSGADIKLILPCSLVKITERRADAAQKGYVNRA